MLKATSAILPSRDFDQTSAFYTKIGFEETGRWSDHGYMILRMDEIEVHFFGHPDQKPYDSDHGVYIRTTDVDKLDNHLKTLDLPANGIPRYHPVEDKEWGMRELAILDPDGNLLRVGQFL
ncbi:VOC family protein [Actibacterium sp. 188UL27-1]|uniref:bleomycin resistance protein n=1 Tax=Actibacterium sp. 188UL27-1 TaxID=2786961 RepID=UPI001958CA2C|nr:VOC family protein [Actibacterium sp. 188UL27-1]MBM7068405.1 VOC family protein [Actibacterium sp. 188UL27-1]